MQQTEEMWVWFLSLEDSLEEGTATHSSILAWRIPRTEEPGRLQSTGSQRVGHDWVTKTFTFICLLVWRQHIWNFWSPEKTYKDWFLKYRIRSGSIIGKAMQEMGFQSLGREDPLEKEMATHSRILAWRIPRTEEPGRLQSRVTKSQTQPTNQH